MFLTFPFIDQAITLKIPLRPNEQPGANRRREYCHRPFWSFFASTRSPYSLFLVATGVGWVIAFGAMDSETKWGQVVGNIVSEWTQILGLVLMTMRLMEAGSKEH